MMKYYVCTSQSAVISSDVIILFQNLDYKRVR